MGTNIEEALIKLGIGGNDVSKILEYVPQIIIDYEHNFHSGNFRYAQPLYEIPQIKRSVKK